MGVYYKTDSDSGEGDLQRVNLNPGGSLWGTAVLGVDLWGGGTDRKNEKINLRGKKGKRLQLKFSNLNTVGSAFKVIRGRFYYNVRGWR
jgi:hypothetical protein